MAAPRSAGGRVLITRPAAAAAATAAAVAALGFVPVVAPLQTVRRLPPRLPPPDRVQAVLVTSSQALAGLDAGWHGRPLLAVGAATAGRAREAGFRTVASADGDAMALAALVRARCDPAAGALLLATAQGEGGRLAAALRGAGFRLHRRAVYAVQPAARLPAAAAAALSSGAVVAALFFAPSAARAFARLLPRALAPACLQATAALAISPAAAAPLAPLPWRRIRVASRPDQAALLHLLVDERR